MSISAQSTLNGSVSINSGSILSITGNTITSGGISGNGGVTVTGVLNWFGGTLTNISPLTVNGSLNILQPPLLPNTGNTINIFGTMSYTGTNNFDITSSSIVIALGGIYSHSGSGGLNPPTSTITLNGLFNAITSSNTVQISTQIINSGFFNITGSGTCVTTGFLQTTTGVLTLYGNSKLATNNTQLIINGLLKGYGSITLPNITLYNVKAGFSPGNITINGAFTLPAKSILYCEVSGLQSFQHDFFIVNGLLSFVGILQINITGNYTPSGGDNFAFITFQSLGIFQPSNISFQYPNANISFNIIGNQVILGFGYVPPPPINVGYYIGILIPIIVIVVVVAVGSTIFLSTSIAIRAYTSRPKLNVADFLDTSAI